MARQEKSRWADELEELYRSYDGGSSVGGGSSAGGGGSLLIPSMDVLKAKRSGAPRFPPKGKVELPAALPRDGAPVFGQEPPLRGKVSPDVLKQMRGLEALMVTLYEQIAENRDQCRKHGKYLYALPSPPPDREVSVIKQLAAKDLGRLLEDAMTLVNNLNIIRTRKVHEILPQDIASSSLVLSNWSRFVTSTCEALRSEASTSEIVLHNLLDLADDLVNTNIGASCRIDGIEPDWGNMGHFKDVVKTSNKAICYVAWMEARGLPICDAVFEFMQSPSQHGNILAIVGYTWAPRELYELLEFMATNAGRTPLMLPVNEDDDDEERRTDEGASAASDNLYEQLKTKTPLYISNSIHQLILDECMLNDYDMSSLASHVPAFSKLHTLCLRGNSISSTGITTLATSLWDRASEIRSLRLDRNSIGPEGALALSKAIHRCRYITNLSISFNPIGDVGLFYILRALMNPSRKARGFLPRPFQLSQKDGGYDFEDDIQSNYSDDEDLMHRLIRLRDGLSYDDVGDESVDESLNDDSIYGSEAEVAKRKGARRKGRKKALKDEESDVYTMGTENEDVYTVSLSRRNSVQLHESDASTSLSRLSSRFDLVSLSNMPLFLRKFRQVRFKIIAIAAFMRLRSRGHSLSSLAVAGCGLSSFSIGLIAHALVDDHNVCSLDMSSNSLGLDEAGDVTGDDAVDVLTGGPRNVSGDYDVTFVLDFALNSLQLDKCRLREAILLARFDGERYEHLLFELSKGSGIHVDKLESVVFPAILAKDRKELFADIFCRTGLASLSMRSCGLLDRDVQIIVGLLNKVVPRIAEMRECAESCSIGILKMAECVEDSKRLEIMLRGVGIELYDDDNDGYSDAHNQQALAALGTLELDAVANFLYPEYRTLFLQGFQRCCSIQSIDLSDNHLGPVSANWIAAATGTYFADDLQLSVGYRAPITLPRKHEFVVAGGHSQRQVRRSDGGDEVLSDVDEDYDGRDDGNLAAPATGLHAIGEFSLDARRAVHDAKNALKSAPGRLVKKLFSTEQSKREML